MLKKYEVKVDYPVLFDYSDVPDFTVNLMDGANEYIDHKKTVYCITLTVNHMRQPLNRGATVKLKPESPV